MITNNNKKLAQWAIDYALKNGCQSAKSVLYANSNTSFELRNGKMDKLQQASEGGMSISLYVDGRYGNFSSNRLNQKELESFINNGIDSIKYLAQDTARKLPDSSRYYKGGNPDLKLYDSTINSVQPDDKVELAKKVADEILGKDDRIISVDSSYSDGESFAYRITSNGFEGESKSTWFSLSSGVAIKGEGEARPSDGWYESSLYFNDLIKDNVGRTGLERVLRKLGQKKIKSGKYTMVLDSLNASQMLRPLLSAINGSALQQKTSFLLNKLNEKIGSDKMTLTDDPHLVKAFGARYFDNEGVATKRRSIFDKGVLNTYFIDTYNANKMGIEPTISSPSVIVMETGKLNLNELIGGVDKGILVTGFNGGNSNSTTGDFSYGIEGFMIENGKLTQPISEMNVTGNLIQLWASLTEVGNDPRLDSSWRIPSLMFENVNFSGL